MTVPMDLVANLLPLTDEKLKVFISETVKDLPSGQQLADTIFEESKLTLMNDSSLEDLLESLVLVAVQNIQNDPIYDLAGARFLLCKAYLTALPDHKDESFDQAYRESFVDMVKWGVGEGILDKRMETTFNLYELAVALKPERDLDFSYIGLSTALNRYAIKNRMMKGVRETPQFMWMRVAMGMSLLEKEPTKWAKKFYEKLSRKEYTAGGSTMIGAGTVWPTLANCFLLDTDDDTVHIFENVTNVALISKGTGGIGLNLTKLRAEGSPVKTNNTFSSGPIPFANIYDATVTAIARAGKKKGAVALYMENWHYNFNEFLDLKQNAGDDYRRTRTANTACYLSDEFIKRVINDEEWYMFDPLETPELAELYGAEFSKKYREYVEKAENGKIRLWKKTRAKEQFKVILSQLQSTAHPWITFKDTINLRALNNNTGTIHCSNLCTEVCLPQDRNNIAVCNLDYVSISRHILTDKVVYGGTIEENLEKAVDWDKLEETVRIGLRHLDNLIDVGMAPVKEAKHSDLNNRAVGLGLMGLSEALELLGYAYDEEEAYVFMDRITEFISYTTIDESCNLAGERGTYPNFEGSMWSKGFVPFDTMQKVEDDRGVELKQNRDYTLDWDFLRERVKKGMRNATTMMIAPNGNSSLTADTSPGIDPRFALIFSRTTMNGKFLDINKNLVNKLKELNLWEKVREDLLRNQGDISNIDLVPDEIKRVYKTSFQISPYAYVEIASRAQKWIDQSMSRNMYFDERAIEPMMEVYLEAWRRGVKTTYYLHMKPRHSAEQSTVKVNKGTQIGKKGFGTLRQKDADESTGALIKDEVSKEIVEEVIETESAPMVDAPAVAEAKVASRVGFAKRASPKTESSALISDESAKEAIASVESDNSTNADSAEDKAVEQILDEVLKDELESLQGQGDMASTVIKRVKLPDSDGLDLEGLVVKEGEGYPSKKGFGSRAPQIIDIDKDDAMEDKESEVDQEEVAEVEDIDDQEAEEEADNSAKEDSDKGIKGLAKKFGFGKKEDDQLEASASVKLELNEPEVRETNTNKPNLKDVILWNACPVDPAERAACESCQ